jgi:hypothetical protein
MTLGSPKGYFVSYAQRLAKIRIFIRGNAYYTFWRNVVDQAFLQFGRFAKIAATTHSSISARFQLSSFGNHSGVTVRNNQGITSHQQGRYSPIQRRIFTDARVETISRAINAAPVSQAPASGNDPEYRPITRQFESISIPLTRTTPQLDLRLGFDGARHLRRTATRCGRLQSEKARSALVSSLALLRVLFSRVLAWQSPTRQYRSRNRSNPFYKALPGQGALHYCKKPYSISHGFRILFQSCHRLFGYHRVSIRYCRQGISSHPATCSCVPVSGAWQWMGNGGVPRKGSSYVEKIPSVYRCAAAYTSNRGRGRPIDAFQGQKIRLSCIRHQSDHKSLESVPVLQSSRDNREKYPRTRARLSAQQNTHRRLARQCGVLSAGSVCCQYRPLVQTTLFAAGISLGIVGYHSHRFPCIAGSTCQKARTQRGQTPARLPLPERISQRFSENRIFTAAKNISFLQKPEISFPMKMVKK